MLHLRATLRRVMSSRRFQTRSGLFTLLFVVATGCSDEGAKGTCSSDVSACLRLQTQITTDVTTLPLNHGVLIQLRAAPDHGWYGDQTGVPTIGVQQFDMYSHLGPLPTGADTIRLWIVAKLLDTAVGQAGVPFPIIAIDSTLQLIHFTRPGALIRTDTVQFYLRRIANE